MPQFYKILDNGVSPMASKKASKAYTLRMTKQAQKPAKNDKPSQFKKVGDFRPGGMFSTGRAIKAQPETRKKASVSAKAAGASKEKRVAGPRVRGMDDAGPVVRAGVGKKQSAKKPKASMMLKAASASSKKEKAKSMMRPAAKATGARDRNRRTY
jgi:hypothetical protein